MYVVSLFLLTLCKNTWQQKSACCCNGLYNTCLFQRWLTQIFSFCPPQHFQQHERFLFPQINIESISISRRSSPPHAHALPQETKLASMLTVVGGICKEVPITYVIRLTDGKVLCCALVTKSKCCVSIKTRRVLHLGVTFEHFLIISLQHRIKCPSGAMSQIENSSFPNTTLML